MQNGMAGLGEFRIGKGAPVGVLAPAASCFGDTVEGAGT
jgi:hypothetical protein